ncbi:helix-turn-helix domain-containing protein [Amnibacterium setariae]|uniref:AraC family transcriptional regulator n=1 Tax=Amnibacterium setariae TaxID=2306585 RepID=A0A3A1TYF2_9MICO|nr:AraC family transcriptional regulator [Amnibacterium setariae]RIX28618.1 AraC family transcriptional regulator [Amnibacterium setariae]
MADASRVSPLSALSLASIPRTVKASSAAAGWSALLVERHVVHAHRDVLELPPTPDRTVVIGLRGGQRLELFGSAPRQVHAYGAASVGFTDGGQGLSLRRLPVDGVRSFEKVNLYLPAATIAEAQDAVTGSRQGARWPGGPVQDPDLAAMSLVILRAAARGASELYAQAAAHWLALHLVERHLGLERTGDRGHRRRDQRIAAAVDLIDSSFALPLTLDDMARAARVSKFHFARLFTEVMGVPPHRYLVRKRLELAVALLTDTDLSVADVARRTGFSRTASFRHALADAGAGAPEAIRAGRGARPLDVDARRAIEPED